MEPKTEHEHIVIDTATGPHELPSVEKFKIMGYMFNREGKMQDPLEEKI